MRHCFSCSHSTEEIGSSDACVACLRATDEGFDNWCPEYCLGIWDEEEL